VFTQHEKVIRRGGCVAALKNIAYSAHLSNNGVQDLLDPSLNFLVYILLPLAGPEDFTDEVCLFLLDLFIYFLCIGNPRITR
jgi:hypothetical protein